jgi:amidohydrolase
MLEEIKSLANLHFPSVQKFREHFHQFPELSFQEKQTTQFIIQTLQNWNIEVSQGPLDTGCVAWIKGKNPNNKTISLRADIDALPIQESNTSDYKSKHEGIMHACGHDVHTSCLLGAVYILNQIKDQLNGTVQCIFQPGEEVLPGGAKLLIEKGVLAKSDSQSILGQHVHPTLEAGKIGIKAGIFMASTDEIHLNIKGKGGHAAMPNEYINPIVIASKIVDQLTSHFMLQDASQKNIPTVFAIGDIKAHGATNVIPESCMLKGTFRTMDETWRSAAHDYIQNSIAKVCDQYQAQFELNIIKGYPVLHNNESLTAQIKSWSEVYLGKDNVIDLPIRMTAEDFAYYSQIMPACFYRLGTNLNNDTFTSGVHTPTFDINPKALEIGSGLMAWLAYQQLK